MRIISTLLAATVCGTCAFAQSTKTQMHVKTDDGQTTTYNIANISEITFTVEDEPVVPTEKNYSIAVPKAADFGLCRVLKVTDADGKKIAEIDYEYVAATKAQYVVVYPILANGQADLANGLIADNGAKITWDYTANTATIGEAAEAFSTIYYVDGALTLAAPDGVVAATVAEDLLVDERANEKISYAITKIGTQYWMAENLRATYYADGTPIPNFENATTDEWKANKSGAYYPTGDATAISLFGLVYSGYAVVNEAGLAPKGWTIPTQSQMTALKKAGSNANANFREVSDIWGTTSAPSTNATGFSALPVGNWSYAADWAATNEMQLWTSTKYYDGLTKSDNLDFVRITTKASMVVSSSALGGHLLDFCQSVRAMRQATTD